jgi:hypothetical protein
MLKRIAALLLVLLFAGQALAGGIVCGIDAISNGLSETDEAACPMRSAGECDEMACCAQGKSPTGALAAMICCEVKCGESTSGALFNFAPLTLTPAPPIVSIRFVSLDPVREIEASAAAISIKSAANNLLNHDPPDLFLSNSTFLI